TVAPGGAPEWVTEHSRECRSVLAEPSGRGRRASQSPEGEPGDEEDRRAPGDPWPSSPGVHGLDDGPKVRVSVQLEPCPGEGGRSGGDPRPLGARQGLPEGVTRAELVRERGDQRPRLLILDRPGCRDDRGRPGTEEGPNEPQRSFPHQHLP